MPARVFISVCETSADVHAASLVRAARDLGQDWTFRGLTGPRLRELGVETVYDFASHAAMLGGVLGVVGRAWQALAEIERDWRRCRPDLVVLLDSPELHLKVAARARRLRIPVLYYIAPQTWASRAYRNRQIRRDVDVLACILPFEERYFGAITGSDRGITGPDGRGEDSAWPRKRVRCAGAARRFQAVYVGHPLFEQLGREQPVPATINFLRQRAAGRPIVALLPGSRRHVIDTMLPLQLDVLQRLRAAGHDVYAAISCADDPARPLIRRILAQFGGERDAFLPAAARQEPRPPDAGIDVVVADNASLLTVADLVLVASGTATLHVAHYRKPMIVMYDAGTLLRWPYRLFGRYLLTTPHLSLVNILAGARIVPEFMPVIADTAPIAAVARQLLTDSAWRGLMVRQLESVVGPLAGSNASAGVCQIIKRLLAGGPDGDVEAPGPGR